MAPKYSDRCCSPSTSPRGCAPADHSCSSPASSAGARKPQRWAKGIANGALAYAATHLAVELAPIRVNVIAPGIIDSGTWDLLGDERKHALLTRSAADGLVGRHGELTDVAGAALWLLSAGYVTGEVIHVDGGARHR